MDDLADAYRGWIDDAVGTGVIRREWKWTESVAVGSAPFVHAAKEKLGIRVQGREVLGSDGSYVLRETSAPYKAVLGQENDGLRRQNGYLWEDTAEIPAT
jgi:putative transposase